MNAVVQRARSERTRAKELRKHAELLSRQLADNLRRFDGPPFGDAGARFSLRLARLRPAVALLRHNLGRWLELRGVTAEHAHDLILAASEACANAVEHPVAGRGAFEVEALCGEREVTIVVRNDGFWRSQTESDFRGRGLRLIRTLMNDVDLVQGQYGSEIVMRRRLD
jgi:anti-sigma regulatory factor (Ser/Thr protein kinase)